MIPAFLRVRQGRNFKPGAWSLGKWGVPIGIAASAFVAIETILFCLPQGSPITAPTFNYAPIALVTALILAAGWWYVRGRDNYAPPTGALEDDHLSDVEVG